MERRSGDAGLAHVVRIALLALLMAFGSLAQAQIADINSAINKAGRQRMLSQRMAKAYLQIGLNVDLERSKRTLDGAIALFDRQLVELKNFAPTPQIRDTYLQLEQNWLAYKDVLIGSVPSPDGARKVLELSESVLRLAHAGTEQLVSTSGSESGPLVGVAGRQRMLSRSASPSSIWRRSGASLRPAARRLRRNSTRAGAPSPWASRRWPAPRRRRRRSARNWSWRTGTGSNTNTRSMRANRASAGRAPPAWRRAASACSTRWTRLPACSKSWAASLAAQGRARSAAMGTP